jgi:hypothetical protein
VGVPHGLTSELKELVTCHRVLSSEEGVGDRVLRGLLGPGQDCLLEVR